MNKPLPISKKIFNITGRKVMLDKDLAQMYGITTANLNKAVKRNMNRFPKDFMFQLSENEYESLVFHFGIPNEDKSLKSQFVTSKKGRGGRRTLPFAFTEQGVAMLSSVLKSDRAADVNVAIMRAFMRMRELLVEHKDLARKINAMENKYDSQFKIVFDALRELIKPPTKPARRIGFKKQ